MALNNLRDYGVLSAGELFDQLLKEHNEERFAKWIGEHLVVYGPVDAGEQRSGPSDESSKASIPTLFVQNAKPSISNFVLLLWNRLFSYPHKVAHINAVFQGTLGSQADDNFDKCLHVAVNTFADNNIADKLLKARCLLKSALHSSWRLNKTESFQMNTEAVTKLTLQFNSEGQIIGGSFDLQWLNDGAHLIEIYDSASPTFNLLRNMISWIDQSERELDLRVFGKNLKKHLKEVDTDAESAQEFDLVKAALQALIHKDNFLPVFRYLAGILHLARVRAEMDQNNKINIYSPDGLNSFAELFKIDSKELRLAIITEFGKSKSDHTMLLGTKDPDAVNKDIKRLIVVLYRSLIEFLVNEINSSLSQHDAQTTMAFIESPNVKLQADLAISDYDSFCKNVVSDMFGFTLFQNKNQWTRNQMASDEVRLPDAPQQWDDFMGFYFDHGKVLSLISILMNERNKKDSRRIAKQIQTDLKNNRRVLKPSAKTKKNETMIGLCHFNENVFWYDLRKVVSEAHSVLPPNIYDVLLSSTNPIILPLKRKSKSKSSLMLLLDDVSSLSKQIVSQRSVYFFSIGTHDRFGNPMSKEPVSALHLHDLFQQQLSDSCEVISHSIVFHRYFSIVHRFNPQIKPSNETTSSTIQRLHLTGRVGKNYAYFTPNEFYKLEVFMKQYIEKVQNCQRIFRGFLGRRHYQRLQQQADEYRSQVRDALKSLKRTQKVFKEVQRDFTKATVETADVGYILSFMKKTDAERAKIHKSTWGILDVISYGEVLYKLKLIYDFYWIFGDANQRSSKPYEVNLSDLPCFQNENRHLARSIEAGFYMQKMPDGDIFIKRKLNRSLRLWGTEAEFRNCAEPSLVHTSDGILPYNSSVKVFDVSLYKKHIAAAIHRNQVSSKAIESQSIIPLIFDVQDEYNTLSEIPLCCVLVDYTIKDRLRLDIFNKQIREEVNRLQKKSGNTGINSKSRKLYSHEASIHSLLIRMDGEFQSLKIDSIESGQRRKREKWSKEAYNRRKLEESCQ